MLARLLKPGGEAVRHGPRCHSGTGGFQRVGHDGTVRVCVVGSGGREHALAWKIAQSLLTKRLVIAPGNPGMEKLGELVDIKVTDADALVDMLAEGGIVAGTIRDMSQVRAGHAGVSADLFVDVHAAGRAPISLPGLPVNLDGIRRQPARLPALGEHTEQVLAELGG